MVMQLLCYTVLLYPSEFISNFAIIKLSFHFDGCYTFEVSNCKKRAEILELAYTYFL